MEQIQNFESGQVYEIVYKDSLTGNFISSNEIASKLSRSNLPHPCHKFLIYIINKQVFINDELHTLTIIKDITFGVLYEQIKAQ